jgi:N-acetylglutamate synthase-like GNAT family acetyltransferase
MVVEISDKSINLYPIEDKDMMILNEIYGSTREKELKQVVYWSDEQKRAFILQQFMAQHEYYQKNYIGAAFYTIQKNKVVIGRLYIHENFQEKGVRIIDITILPNWQNKGIGKGILKDILSKSSKLNRAVSIHVETFNPAMKLYKDLGFEKISETNGVYHLLEWKQKQLIKSK